jgi:hypothetical protein
MPEKVTIPISFLEYDAEFVRPIFAALMDRASIVQAIFDAMSPWKLEIDNVEPITSGKPSEQGIKFKIPEKKVTFLFGAGSCRFTKDDADWASAEETIGILAAALDALKASSGAAFSAQHVAFALHIQPKKAKFLDLLKPFLSPILQELEGEGVKWDRRRVVLDGSGALANALFLKFEREFDGSSNLREIAIQMKTDEDTLFKILDIEEEL